MLLTSGVGLTTGVGRCYKVALVGLTRPLRVDKRVRVTQELVDNTVSASSARCSVETCLSTIPVPVGSSVRYWVCTVQAVDCVLQMMMHVCFKTCCQDWKICRSL